MRRLLSTWKTWTMSKYVVAFNTNEGYLDSWFAAFDGNTQIFTKKKAEAVKKKLEEAPTSTDAPILAMILPINHPRVIINPRTNYVRVI